MNKKSMYGFTLIELLAVIVLLSILISIMVVSIESTINVSEKKLSNVQIENIEEASKIYYMKEGYSKIPEYIDSFELCVDTDYLIRSDYIEKEKILDPETYETLEGSVLITNKAEQYTYKYQKSNCKFEYKSLDKVCIAVNEDTKTIGNIPKALYNKGDEYICEVKEGVKYNFFVIGTSGDKVNLILDKNINSDGTLTTEAITVENAVDGIYNIIPWISSEDYTNKNTVCTSTVCNDEGPITAINFLDSATKSWVNIPNLNDAYADEGNKYSTIGLSKKARLPKLSEVSNNDDTNQYLYQYLDSTEWLGTGAKPSMNILGIYGYWTLSSDSSAPNLSWYVGSNGNIGSYEVINSNRYGIRPVISIPKINISNISI